MLRLHYKPHGSTQTFCSDLKRNYCQAYRYMVAQMDRTQTVLDDDYMKPREF